MTAIRTRVAGIVLSVIAVSAGGCGTDDSDRSDSGGESRADAEQDIRSAISQFEEAREQRQWRRACDLLTPRAAAQLTALADAGADDCEAGLVRSEPEDDRLTAALIAKADIKVRGDHAVFTAGAGDDGARTGLREIDGAWRLDNVLDPSLEEPPRHIDPRLSEGTDEQQVRATQKAVTRAFARRDYDVMCDLFGYAAEAQLFMTALFTAVEDDAQDRAPDRFSCAAAVRLLEKLARDKDEFVAGLPSDAQIDAAKITFRGDRATVHVPGEDPEYMVRQDGRWLVGPDPDGFS